MRRVKDEHLGRGLAELLAELSRVKSPLITLEDEGDARDLAACKLGMILVQREEGLEAAHLVALVAVSRDERAEAPVGSKSN